VPSRGLTRFYIEAITGTQTVRALSGRYRNFPTRVWSHGFFAIAIFARSRID